MSLLMMNPKEITTHPTFSALFPIKWDVLARIEEDMKETGYDESQPVVLAKWKGQEEPVCIDGHTRLRAALNVGIESIPVFVWLFDDELAALARSIRGQVNRRRSSLTDSEVFTIVRLLHGKKTQRHCGRYEHAVTGSPISDCELPEVGWVKKTARLLQTSTPKVEKALFIQTNATPSIVRAVEDGKTSIVQAYKQAQKRSSPPLFPSFDIGQLKLMPWQETLTPDGCL